MHYTHIAYNLGVGGECGPSRGEGRGTKEGGADGTKQQKCGKRKGHGQATPAMPTDLWDDRAWLQKKGEMGAVTGARQMHTEGELPGPRAATQAFRPGGFFGLARTLE